MNSLEHNREWSDPDTVTSWNKQVENSSNISDIARLCITLDDGLSLPFYMMKRENKTSRLRLQLFKFWPNTDLRDSWRAYTLAMTEGQTMCLSVCITILEQTLEQYI